MNNYRYTSTTVINDGQRPQPRPSDSPWFRFRANGNNHLISRRGTDTDFAGSAGPADSNRYHTLCGLSIVANNPETDVAPMWDKCRKCWDVWQRQLQIEQRQKQGREKEKATPTKLTEIRGYSFDESEYIPTKVKDSLRQMLNADDGGDDHDTP
jgi:hypothetical protein